MTENAAAGKKGEGSQKGPRLELERKTGKRVVTVENFLPPATTRKKIKGPDDEYPSEDERRQTVASS